MPQADAEHRLLAEQPANRVNGVLQRLGIAGPVGQENPVRRLRQHVLEVLKDEGYIKDYRLETGEAFDTLVVELKYGRSRERVITDLRRISKPGRRVYACKDRPPRVLGGMGTAIMSTSRGLVTSRTAQELGVGGEVLCFVW